MKIISIDNNSDRYDPKLIVEINSSYLSNLSTGFDREKSKAGDTLSLEHARTACKVFSELSSAKYHLNKLKEPLEKFETLAIELGLIK